MQLIYLPLLVTHTCNTAKEDIYISLHMVYTLFSGYPMLFDKLFSEYSMDKLASRINGHVLDINNIDE